MYVYVCICIYVCTYIHTYAASRISPVRPPAPRRGVIIVIIITIIIYFTFISSSSSSYYYYYLCSSSSSYYYYYVVVVVENKDRSLPRFPSLLLQGQLPPLSKTTCLPQVFFESGEYSCKLWRSLPL